MYLFIRVSIAVTLRPCVQNKTQIQKHIRLCAVHIRLRATSSLIVFAV